MGGTSCVFWADPPSQWLWHLERFFWQKNQPITGTCCRMISSHGLQCSSPLSVLAPAASQWTSTLSTHWLAQKSKPVSATSARIRRNEREKHATIHGNYRWIDYWGAQNSAARGRRKRSHAAPSIRCVRVRRERDGEWGRGDGDAPRLTPARTYRAGRTCVLFVKIRSFFIINTRRRTPTVRAGLGSSYVRRLSHFYILLTIHPPSLSLSLCNPSFFAPPRHHSHLSRCPTVNLYQN